VSSTVNEYEEGVGDTALSPMRSARVAGGGSEMRLARGIGKGSGLVVREGRAKGVIMGDAEASAGKEVLSSVGRDIVMQRMDKGGESFMCVMERTALGFCR
jgi:hypothetical protein